MNAKDRASQKATKKTKKYPGNVSAAVPASIKLTSYDDLIEGYETTYVRTPSGLAFEIQTIDPGMFLSIFGTPFISMLIEKKATDEESVNMVLASMTEEDKIKMANDPALVNNILEIICRSVISVKLVNKRQSECNNDEISIIMLIETGKLTQEDITYLYKSIFELVKPEEIAKTAESFLRKVKKSEAGINANSSDSENLSFETEQNSLSEYNEQ